MIRVCLDVVTADDARAALVRQVWGCQTGGCFLHIRQRTAVSHMAAQLEAVACVNSTLAGGIETYAVLLLRPDLNVKQPLLLPAPALRLQPQFVFPFFMEGCSNRRMTTPLGNKRVSDAFVFIPAALVSTFVLVASSHLNNGDAHNFMDWCAGAKGRQVCQLGVVDASGTYDSDPSKCWNPLYSFAGRHEAAPRHRSHHHIHELTALAHRTRNMSSWRLPCASEDLRDAGSTKDRSLTRRRPAPTSTRFRNTSISATRVNLHPLVVAVLPRRDPSRYFSILDIGNGRGAQGEVWLVARSGAWPHAAPNETSVLWQRCTAELDILPSPRQACAKARTGHMAPCVDPCAPSIAPAPQPHVFRVPSHVAHNMAIMLDLPGSRELLVVGGQFRERAMRDGPQLHVAVPGVLGFSARLADISSVVGVNSELRTPPLHLLLRGDHAGCIDLRDGFQGRCEFDGRLSLARSADGRLHVYARANQAVGGGGRHVQVATSLSGRLKGPFTPFRPLQIDGYPTPYSTRPGVRVNKYNTYFAAVKANPADNGRTLLGLFPIRTSRECFIGMAFSCDGVHFSKMHRFVDSEPSDTNGRGVDHPVDGLIVRGSFVYVYVHRNVPGVPLAPRSRRSDRASMIVRYALPMADLRRMASELSASCKREHAILSTTEEK